MNNYTAMNIPYLKLRASSEKGFKCLNMILIRKGLDNAIHEVILSKFIFTVDYLKPRILLNQISACFCYSQI